MRRDEHWGFNCHDCGINTVAINEYYMVNKPLWISSGMDTGMLCIGCLEERIGRQLVPDDFTDYPVNRPETSVHSSRLANRLGYRRAG